MTWPTTCIEVTWEFSRDTRDRISDAEVGDLLWNPKGGEGHVLIKELVCGELTGTGEHPEWPANCVGCGTCEGWGLKPGGLTLVCECGEDSRTRDHHYWILARKP